MRPSETDHTVIDEPDLLVSLARQIDESVSFRDAVRRSLVCLLEEAELTTLATGYQIPSARTGSEPLPDPLVAEPGPASVTLIEALGAALHERSSGADLQAATRVAEVVVRMSTSWVSLPGVMSRDHYVEATIGMAVAVASQSVFSPVIAQR